MNDSNVASSDLKQAAHDLMDTAHGIITKAGENRQSMHEIGQLLIEMWGTGVLDEVMKSRPGENTASMDLFAQHQDGSMLTFYAMDGWESPQNADVHWHNYWQVLLDIGGTWRDTIWRTVTDVSDGVAYDVKVDRREAISNGEIQILNPDEPHGWETGERRRADGVYLLMWSGSAQGKPRIDLDPETGKLTEAFGFLNPDPQSTARDAAEDRVADRSFVRRIL